MVLRSEPNRKIFTKTRICHQIKLFQRHATGQRRRCTTASAGICVSGGSTPLTKLAAPVSKPFVLPRKFNSLFHCSDREDNWLHWSSSAHSKRGRHQLSSSRTAGAAICSHRHTEALQPREHSQTARLALCVGHRSRQRHARLRQLQLGIIVPQSVFQSLEASLRCVEAGNALESIRLRTYAGEL